MEKGILQKSRVPAETKNSKQFTRAQMKMKLEGWRHVAGKDARGQIMKAKGACHRGVI